MALVGEERAGWPKGGGVVVLAYPELTTSEAMAEEMAEALVAVVRMVAIVETPGGWLVVVVMVEAPGG